MAETTPLFKRGDRVSSVVFRRRTLEIAGKWCLPSHYDPQEDVVLELVTTRKPSKKVQDSISKSLDESGVWCSFDGKSLFVFFPTSLAYATLADAKEQVRCYAMKKGNVDEFLLLPSPLWKSKEGKFFIPQKALFRTCEPYCPSEGILAFEIGERHEEPAWRQLVESGPFSGVLALMPGCLDVVLITRQGTQRFHDPDFVDLGELLSGFQLYLTALPRLLWPTLREDRRGYKTTNRKLADILCKRIREGNVEEAKAAVCFMSCIDTYSSFQVLPLVLAVSKNMEELVEFMCEFKVDVDRVDWFGETARASATGKIRKFIDEKYPDAPDAPEGLTVSAPEPSKVKVSGLTSENLERLIKMVHGHGRKIAAYYIPDAVGETSTMCLRRLIPDASDPDSLLREVKATLMEIRESQSRGEWENRTLTVHAPHLNPIQTFQGRSLAAVRRNHRANSFLAIRA